MGSSENSFGEKRYHFLTNETSTMRSGRVYLWLVGGSFMRISPRLLLTLTGLGLLPLTGCTGAFDGTWLFQWDRSSVQTATNCEDEDEDESLYSGDRYEWIDIYTTSGGALVLTNGEQELVGIVDGDGFTVEATYGELVGGNVLEWTLEIEATLDGKDLSGSSDYKEIDDIGDETCRSQQKQSFAGVKMVGTDAAQRTIGTQSSQSSSTN